MGLLKSLDKFLDECREKFDYYQQQAVVRCGSSTYKCKSQREPKCERYLSDGDASDAVEGMTSQQTFKVTTFYVIIDQLKNTLVKRIEAYFLVLQIFGVVLTGKIPENLGKWAPNVVWLQNMAPKVCRKTSEDHFLGGHTAKTVGKSCTVTFLVNLGKFGQISLAPLRICLLLHICVKRSTMGQQRLDTLALLRIESNLLKKLT